MVTTMIDHAQADFWIVPAETKSFEGSSLLAGRERLQALSVDGVTQAIPVVVGYASWRKPNGGASTPVLVVGAPTTSAGLQPWNVVEGSLDDLSMPDGVAIDRSYFEQLGIAQIRGRAEINNQKARVVAVTNGIRSFTTTPQVFASLERARTYLGVPPNQGQLLHRAHRAERKCRGRSQPACRQPVRRGGADVRGVSSPHARVLAVRHRRRSCSPGQRHTRHHRRHDHRRADALFKHQGPSQGVCDAARHRLVAHCTSSRSFSPRRSSAPSSVSPLRPLSTWRW